MKGRGGVVPGDTSSNSSGVEVVEWRGGGKGGLRLSAVSDLDNLAVDLLVELPRGCGPVIAE